MQQIKLMSKLGLALASGAVMVIATMAIVFVFDASNVDKVYAVPLTCVFCEANGTGQGTITIPVNTKVAIPPYSCIECDAEISFKAITDSTGTSGTVTIEYQVNGIEESITSTVDSLKLSKDACCKFTISGLAEIAGPELCEACQEVAYTLEGKFDRETDIATLVFRADGGVRGDFESTDVTVAIIGPNLTR